MASKNKIITTVIILLSLSVLFSGCTAEKKSNPVPLHNDTVDGKLTKPDLPDQEANKTEVSVNESSGRKTTPLDDEIEIELISLSNIYIRDNQNINRRNISDQYYAVYDISIKNNGSKAFDFRPDEFKLRSRNRMFKQAAIMSKAFDMVGLSYISTIENEMNDTTLLPSQTINGSVIFGVSSPSDRTFILTYNMTPVDSASFRNSIDAVKATELFNYSIALGMPPYYADSYEPPYLKNTYDPPEADYYSGRNIAYPLFIWSNWVNRSILEFYNELDSAELSRLRILSDLPVISSVYRSKVFPEKNITLFPATTQGFATSFLVINDTGQEIFDKSFFKGKWGIAMHSGNTYTVRQFKEGVDFDTKQMTFPDATVVWMTYSSYYGWPMGSRWNFNTQVVILDKEQNIIAVIYDYAHLVS